MPTSRRAQSQKTRRKIFDAAAALMKEYGEDYLTISNICEKANVSKGTFFYHFSSKDELMMYYLKEGFDNFVVERKTLERANDDIYQLVIDLYEDYMTYCQNAGIEFVTNYYTPCNKALDARRNMGGREAMNMLIRANVDGFKKAQDLGYIRSDWTAEDMAYDCCSVVKGCIFEWCVSAGEIDLMGHMKHMLSVYLSSVLTEAYHERFSHDEPPVC